MLSPHFPARQWWNFDLSSLREENRAIVHSVLAWFLYHAVTIGKQPMDIFIDEGWRLLRSGPFTDLLDELGRRARKRGVGVTLITHLPGERRYEHWFERILAWSLARFPDRKFGEWFGYLHRDGSVSHDLKGNMWKGPFHLPREQLACHLMLAESLR